MVKKLPKKLTGRASKNILWFREIGIKDVPLVGGKNASLGEMYSKLSGKGISVPNGFALTAKAYWDFIDSAKLRKFLKQELKGLDTHNIKQLKEVGKKIRAVVLNAKLPEQIEQDVLAAYEKLGLDEKNKKNVAVAVRSSATAEDLPDASFAGQQETYLNVVGKKDLLKAVKSCIASLFTDRAISYRETKGFDHLAVALSVTVQLMVKSDKASSGVMFTLDTESGFPGVALINASWGLGEYVVKGKVTPDQYYVYKDGVKRGKKAVISRIIGSKRVKLVYGKTRGTKQQVVPVRDRNKFVLSTDEAVQLAKWGMQIEQHYKKPQDIEWAKDSDNGKLYIVQSRPETVKSNVDRSVIETFKLNKKGKQLLTGVAVGQKIGAGTVRVIESPVQMKSFKKGDVLVTKITDPDWEPIMRIAAAIVTEEGGKTSHAAIVSRELGVPCVVGAAGARRTLKNGNKVTVSCAEGDEGVIYKGVLPFEVKKTSIKEVKKTKTKIMMNIGDPDNAFNLSFLPSDGVGLARLEFIFSNFLRIHPLALINYSKLKDKQAKKKIAELTRGYRKKTDYCVDKLAEGIARIAAGFKGKPVIVRLSDFKTNEYATLIGGKEFEPKEQNPMLGWRGASRYYSKEYGPGFALECEAIKKVRDEWGLDNVIAMVPFCRTPEEGEKVIKTMEKYGLKRGENSLQVYVMCEIPSNVILAEEFARIFDGFSIGSNDLTQLALGVDRDSALVSHVYDERNSTVLKLIKDVIKVAHKHKRKVGICGQAPSDYPEFAEFLVGQGIDSISLNPDTVVSTRQRIAKVEKTLGNTGKKTNKKFLSLVTALAVAGAAIITIGAGCVGESGYPSVEDDFNGLSAAEIRQKAQEKAQADLEKQRQDLEGMTTTYKENNFANFTINYPVLWNMNSWYGGFNISDPNGDGYVSVFEQLVSHPVPDEQKEKYDNIKGVGSVRYKTTLPDGKEIEVIEINNPEGGVIEVNGYGEKFFQIADSITFFGSDMPDRPLTHWDVREGRVCIQVITYARQTADSECVAYPTPCEVPDNWQVCDQSDL